MERHVLQEGFTITKCFDLFSPGNGTSSDVLVQYWKTWENQIQF